MVAFYIILAICRLRWCVIVYIYLNQYGGLIPSEKNIFFNSPS